MNDETIWEGICTLILMVGSVCALLFALSLVAELLRG